VSNRPPAPAAPPDLDDVLAEVSQPVVRLTHLLRIRTLEAHPDLGERVYRGWRGLGFHHPPTGYLAAIFPQVDDVLVGFNRGGDLPDPHGRLLGTRKRIRYLRFRPDPATGGLADAEGDLLEDYLDLAVDHAVDLRAARG
jgi:hypothetical protein